MAVWGFKGEMNFAFLSAAPPPEPSAFAKLAADLVRLVWEASPASLLGFKPEGWPGQVLDAPILIVLLFGAHLFLTVRTGFIQRFMPRAIKISFSREKEGEAVKYRVRMPDGSYAGGPMYALERGLGQKWLGVVFAGFTCIAAFGIGIMFQANAVVETLKEWVRPDTEG